MPITLDFPHNLRVLDEVVLDLLHNQCSLLRCTRYDSDQAAWIQNANSNTALCRQPGFAVTAGFDHHNRIGITDLTGDYLLGVLLLDAQILLNEHIQMCTPEYDLHRP